MSIKLDVPKVAQDKTMSCWYAAACMVTYYREAGPRFGIPKAYNFNTGIYDFQYSTLAKNEGLKSIKIPKPCTAVQLEEVIKKYGPLWCAGRWYGPKHIIVITGVDTTAMRVWLNDPDGGVEKNESMTWFNDNIYRVVDSVLYYPDSKD